MSEREQIQYVAVKELRFAPQVRERIDEESLKGLAVSLKEVGQQQPIRVRRDDDKPIVVDGERRVRAARMLGWEEIACIFEGRSLSEAEVTQRALIANCQRMNLSGLETARGLRQLMEATEWNASETASHVGFSNSSVSKLLTLLELPIAIQEKIAAGEIAPSTAYEIAKVRDENKQLELADAAAKGDLTRDATTRVAREINGKPGSNAAILKRIRVPLSTGSVTLSAESLTPDGIIAMLAEIANKARRLKARGVPDATFFRMLKAQ
ncbi:MAG: ParB/RepB/Spo0J family partition protein [Planctomycetales bacterium]|nr:ParB/RepB/Spo0J family partition protein [Planctomycetales bacterium]